MADDIFAIICFAAIVFALIAAIVALALNHHPWLALALVLILATTRISIKARTHNTTKEDQ